MALSPPGPAALLLPLLTLSASPAPGEAQHKSLPLGEETEQMEAVGEGEEARLCLAKQKAQSVRENVSVFKLRGMLNAWE